MSGSGREAIPDVQELSEDPLGCPGVVGGLPECPGVVGSPSLMSKGCREALMEVLEAPRMFGSGREALTNIRGMSGGPPECPEVFESHSRMSGSGLVTLPDVREWSRYPPGYPGVAKKPSQMSESGREPLPNVREWSDAFPDVRQ